MDQGDLLGFGRNKESSQHLDRAKRKSRPQHSYFGARPDEDLS